MSRTDSPGEEERSRPSDSDEADYQDGQPAAMPSACGAALQVALRIRSGTVNVNAGVASAYASSGGQRMSGVGRERGIEGLRIYQQLSCLNLGS